MDTGQQGKQLFYGTKARFLGHPISPKVIKMIDPIGHAVNLVSVITHNQLEKNHILFVILSAGIDIKENYLNVLPLKLFPDGRLWVNVGSLDNETRNFQVANLNDLATKDPQILNYQPVDFDKYNYEAYLYEKPFFNM